MLQAKEINGILLISTPSRIETQNAQEVEKDFRTIKEEHGNMPIAIDAGKLEYISSVGLRLLLKFAKEQSGTKLTVQDVSPEVYEIFETTGFLQILDVKKRLREISVERCELIGSGGYGKVYRIDDETIAKLYTTEMSLEMIQKERNTAQKAFLMGVPTAISYDVVKCGDDYGVVYELLKAKTVAQVLDADSSRIQEMGEKSATLLKNLHAITVEDNSLPNRKEEMLEWVEKIAPVLEESEAEEIRTFLQAIPERKQFLHGDFNSKNIMIQGDEFLLIDIGDAAFGHPVFDLAGLLLAYIYLPRSPMPEDEKYRLLGFKLSDAGAMLNTMLTTYFGLANPAEIGEWIQRLMPYANQLAAYHGCRRANYDKEYMKMIVEKVIRARLLPSIRTAKPLGW
jgi:uncharacterized protein (TIGR02172 family)